MHLRRVCVRRDNVAALRPVDKSSGERFQEAIARRVVVGLRGTHPCAS